MELISDRLTLILGAPRSGTTWLAKIFDSHPNVLYRHEPDLVVKSDCIPDICSRDQFDQYVDATRRFFLALLDDRSLKSCGSLPVFPKDYEDRIAYATRRGSVYGLRFLQKILPVAFRQFMKVSVGEPSRDIPTYAVIKSISALGRSGLVLRSLPECRIVLILREPFGQVASRLQGFARDKFERQHLKFEWIDTCEARRFGLTESGLRRMTLAQQLAWEWAILNEKAISELGNSPRVRMIRYTDLVDDPHGQTRDLFKFAGLPWREETERFIKKSTNFKGPDLYYHVYKDSDVTRDKWRRTLSLDEKKQIYQIMQATSLKQFWPELLDNPAEVWSSKPSFRPPLLAVS